MNESLTEEQLNNLKQALVNKIAGNLTFNELIDIITTLSLEEVEKQLKEMTEEEKLQTYNEVFAEEV